MIIGVVNSLINKLTLLSGLCCPTRGRVLALKLCGGGEEPKATGSRSGSSPTTLWGEHPWAFPPGEEPKATGSRSGSSPTTLWGEHPWAFPPGEEPKATGSRSGSSPTPRWGNLRRSFPPREPTQEGRTIVKRPIDFCHTNPLFYMILFHTILSRRESSPEPKYRLVS
jgi:hypothetical protein